MADAGFDACIIAGSDPHGNEIPSKRWQTREWISGFTGSSGTVVVTKDFAGLWTDFRYWTQAAQELSGTEIRLFRSFEPGVPTPEEWLVKNLKPGSLVAFDGQTIRYADAEKWVAAFRNADISFDSSRDLLEDIWPDRPSMPANPVIELSEDESGESRRQRIKRLRLKLQEAGADTWIAAALNLQAWLLNIRGSDIPHTPVVYGYIIVRPDSIRWYTDPERLSSELTLSLESDDIQVVPYGDFTHEAASLPENCRILADPELLSWSVVSHLSAKSIHAPDPVELMKAERNPVELEFTRDAMKKDGAALVKLFIDLERRLSQGEDVGEIQAIELLRKHRETLPGFLGESFSTIAAAGANAALCHYEAKPENQGYLNSTGNIFLLDCGCQWREGTTDITRTVSFNQPSPEERRDYTRVLKAHIALSRIRFPAGTCGYQLDAIARAGLWQQGIDFGHGAGHGVGFRLGVHEGPQSISPKPVDVKLEPGMVVSNEPGIYREGFYGIRIENLMACRRDEKTEFGQFLSFETLSLAPYQRSLIDADLLDSEEIQWIDEYHASVREKLAPLLEADEAAWLEKATECLGKE